VRRERPQAKLAARPGFFEKHEPVRHSEAVNAPPLDQPMAGDDNLVSPSPVSDCSRGLVGDLLANPSSDQRLRRSMLPG
jgi:hypothetical protein